MIGERETFFVAGGTVPPGSPSYVERSADRELYEALLAGEYCYVLNSRQMGKSSLAVRTIARLRDAGVRTAFVDLTRLGGANVSAEQWYAGLLVETGRTLGLRAEAAAFLREHRDLGGAQRYLAFLQEAVLGALDGRIVVMIDEIDATRGLSFSADELFAGIRQLHNGRASDEGLGRLAFCLLGAALPSDLIRDPRTTPFNVGRRIELRDFSREEARAFSEGLGSPSPLVGEGERLVDRVLYWTGGHPFLTQTLCAALADPSPQPSPARGEGSRRVDEIVRERYLDARARETDTNLADVGNRLLGRGDPNVDDAARADALSLYAKLLKGGVPDDESNPSCARIKMSGVARLEGGQLKIRNRIYAEVFGPAWIRENMPGQELRRQRKAFWKGALRAGGIGTAVVAVVSLLATLATLNAQRARKAQREADALRKQAEYDTYAATLMSMPTLAQSGDLNRLAANVDALRSSPYRGWEWSYWNLRAHPADTVIPFGDESHRDPLACLSKDGRLIAVADSHGGSVLVYAVDGSGRKWNVPNRFRGWTRAFLVDHGRSLVVGAAAGVDRIDLATGKVLWSSPVGVGDLATANGADIFLCAGGGIDRLDVATGKVVRVRSTSRNVFAVTPSPDGRYLFWTENDGGESQGRGMLRELATGKETPLPSNAGWFPPAWTPDGRRLIMGFRDPQGQGQSQVVSLDPATQRVDWSIPCLEHRMKLVSVSPDGQTMALTSYQRTAKIYRLDGGAPQLLGTLPEANDALILPDGRFVTIFDALRIYRKETFAPVPRLGWGTTSSISPDGRVYRTSEGRSAAVDALGNGRTESWANPGSFKVLPSSDGALLLRPDPAHDRAVVTPATSTEPLLDLPGIQDLLPVDAFNRFFDRSPDGSRVVVQSRHGFDVFDLRTRARLWGAPVLNAIVGFSPDGTAIVAADPSGDVAAYAANDGKRLWKVRTSSGEVALRTEYSPDGRLLAVSLSDRALLLDATNGRTIGAPLRHSNWVTALAWSPDGRRLATGDFDGLIHVWDAKSQRELTTIGESGYVIYALRFVQEGRTLISIDQAGNVRTWRSKESP